MPIKLLIFDFDGTLVDTKMLYYKSIHKWLNNYGYKFSERDFRKFFGLKLGEILKKLKLKKKINEIKKEVHADVNKSSKLIMISPDIRDIKNLNIKKIVVSNTATNNIKKILGYKNINYFSEVYGGDKFVHKEDFIRKYLRKHKLDKNDVLYIGDMVKDVIVARKAGIKVASISHRYSWDSYSRLKKIHPDYLIRSFRQLKQIIIE